MRDTKLTNIKHNLLGHFKGELFLMPVWKHCKEDSIYKKGHFFPLHGQAQRTKPRVTPKLGFCAVLNWVRVKLGVTALPTCNRKIIYIYHTVIWDSTTGILFTCNLVMVLFCGFWVNNAVDFKKIRKKYQNAVFCGCSLSSPKSFC